MSRQPNFDRIARPYRWLEYLTVGRALERCRLHFLPDLAKRLRPGSHALVLGDGDGRFLARLLATNPSLTADAVDASAAMLVLLRGRCAFAAGRLTAHHADAIAFTRGLSHSALLYDLVVTHFFLDCFTQSEVDLLVTVLKPHLAPDTVWLVSEFRIPSGPMRLPGCLFVRALYLAFRFLTGLRPARLPDYASSLVRAGLVRTRYRYGLFGIVTSELWASQVAARGLVYPVE